MSTDSSISLPSQDLVMSESSSSEAERSVLSMLNPSSRIICRVCQKQFSQYTCPRCNTRYCSLHCYKSHSRSCTESFMRDNVVEELQQLESNDETKQKMMDILRRFHSEEGMDNTDELVDNTDAYDSTLSEEVIQKILSGGEVHFNDLSDDEKKRFQRAVISGELSRLVDPWEPWWLKPAAKSISLSQHGCRLVLPLVENDGIEPRQESMEIDQSLDIPPGPETPLPPISKLSATEPSPLLAVHLVDIIYSYCFTLRFHNGDWLTDPIGAAMLCLSISSVLGHGGKPETVSEALSHCLEQTCSPTLRHVGGLQFGLGLLDDVVSLLSLGEIAIVCLLCDLQKMIQAGERELKLEPHKSRRANIKCNFKSCERKIYFMMCWVHEQPNDVLLSIATLVKAEKSALIACAGNNTNNTYRVQEKMESREKVLIEEV